MATFLHGEKVKLRPIESEEDLRYIFRSFNDPSAAGKYVHFEARSWDSFQTWVREFEKSAELTFFTIVKNDDGKILGSVGYFVPSPVSYSCLEIGYGIDDENERKRGYASEAAKLLVDYLFLTRNIERIQATTNVENLGSQGVLEKIGFTKEGVLRSNDFVGGRVVDDIMYSIIRPDWEKNLKK